MTDRASAPARQALRQADVFGQAGGFEVVGEHLVGVLDPHHDALLQRGRVGIAATLEAAVDHLVGFTKQVHG